jgi:DNA-directed RNA polymerase subunit RPC12/RpoP
MIRCPLCNSDRVIPLNFPQDVGIKPDKVEARPVAKCVVCGHRISESDVQSDASEGPDSN